MATQLTIVNNVLRRLREDTVSSVADNAYAQLIAMFVNDGLEDLNGAYLWSAYMTENRFDTVASQVTYDLSANVSGGGAIYDADTVTNSDSFLVVDSSIRPIVDLYEDASDDSPLNRLRLVNEEDRARMYANDRDYTEDPSVFSWRMRADGDGYEVRLYPTPNAVRLVRLTIWTPQQALAIDGTDDATDIVLPSRVLEAYAHMVAANERGEEIGEPGNLLERRWINFLQQAIETEADSNIKTNRSESWRD